MSDLGLLSHQYQALAELSRQLRHQILYLKRIYFHLPEIKDEQLNQAHVTANLYRVALFLSEVVALDDESAWPDIWLDDSPLPMAVVERLRKEHELDRARYIRQLDRLAEHLRSNLSELTEKDIALLEDIAQATNLDTNAVFRRLMRWA